MTPGTHADACNKHRASLVNDDDAEATHGRHYAEPYLELKLGRRMGKVWFGFGVVKGGNGETWGCYLYAMGRRCPRATMRLARSHRMVSGRHGQRVGASGQHNASERRIE